MNKKADVRIALFCLIAAAAVLLICSMNSYLYPINPWNDVHCFMTVAREMLAGKVPYRDLIEQKGPLLYGLHALALTVSPGNYHGMYWIETLLMAGALFFFHKTARLYAPKINVGWTAVAAMVICVSRAFRYGDSAEQLCLFPVAWSMYAALKSMRANERISMKGYLLHGALAGCILWVKFNLLGFHLVWMGFLAIDALIADRNLKRPVCMCLWFLGGMALASVPWLIYFGANGALDDLLSVYFGMNIGQYGPRRYNFLLYTGAGLMRCLQDPVLAMPLMAAALGVLFAPRRWMGWKEKGFLVCAFGVMAVAIYGMGMRYVYYFMAFAVFLPLAALAVRALSGLVCWGKICRREGMRAAVYVLLLAVGIGGVLRLSANTAWIGYPYEETIQGKVAALLKEEKRPTILNAGELDGGFYFAADAQIGSKWFCELNVDREGCLADHQRCMDEGRTDYVITIGETLEEIGLKSDWPLVAQVESDYGGPEKTARIYGKPED